MAELRTEISKEDLWYILNNPWSISKAEWRIGDENNRKSMFTHIQELLELTVDDGYSKIWKTANDEPIAILGSYKVADKKYTTFLICSHHYDEHVMKLSFEMRKTLRDKALQYKGYTLGIYSISQHPNLFTWLRFLGFIYLPEGNKGNWRYFEFVSPTN